MAKIGLSGDLTPTLPVKKKRHHINAGLQNYLLLVLKAGSPSRASVFFFLGRITGLEVGRSDSKQPFSTDHLHTSRWQIHRPISDADRPATPDPSSSRLSSDALPSTLKAIRTSLPPDWHWPVIGQSRQISRARSPDRQAATIHDPRSSHCQARGQ